MGQPDLGLKDFFTYTDSVAALANCCLFDNQEVIHADQLQHINTEELVTYGEDDKQMRTLSRLRDVCCTVSYRIKEKGNFLILGIENQKTVDHFMVARLLVMFALNLVQQYKKMTGREILMPGSDAGEFLYKYRKGDKFL
ncbi:MAG: hypothetical protein J5746_14485, partial [Victivallales bacterium]|nr:hypothetical protein [Victivallales bacterium]